MAKTNNAPSTTATEHKLEEFAEDLGRLLGTARAKAESWIGQRQEIVKKLNRLRDEASKLLTDLGHEAQAAVNRGRRGRPRASAPAQEATAGEFQPQPG